MLAEVERLFSHFTSDQRIVRALEFERHPALAALSGGRVSHDVNHHVLVDVIYRCDFTKFEERLEAHRAVDESRKDFAKQTKVHTQT